MHYNPYFSDALEIATPNSIGAVDPVLESAWAKCKPSTAQVDADVATIIETIFGKKDEAHAAPAGDILTRQATKPVGLKVSDGNVYIVFEAPENSADTLRDEYTLYDTRCGTIRQFRDLIDCIMEMGALDGQESACVRSLIDFTFAEVPTILPHPAYTNVFLGQCFDKTSFKEAV